MQLRQLMRSALGVLFAITLGASVIAAESPCEIVVIIYKVSAGPDGKYQNTAYDDAALRRRYFSKAFLAALRRREKADEKSGETTIDWDPVTASQDPDLHDLDIKSESQSLNKSTVVANFTLSGTDAQGRKITTSTAVRYDFVKQGGAWKLDDIRGDYGSVRALLAAK